MGLKLYDDGQIYLDGQPFGKLYDDGVIYVNHQPWGKLYDDGEIYKDGQPFGKLYDDGEIYVNNQSWGKLYEDGEIYSDGQPYVNKSNDDIYPHGDDSSSYYSYSGRGYSGGYNDINPISVIGMIILILACIFLPYGIFVEGIKLWQSMTIGMIQYYPFTGIIAAALLVAGTIFGFFVQFTKCKGGFWLGLLVNTISIMITSIVGSIIAEGPDLFLQFNTDLVTFLGVFVIMALFPTVICKVITMLGFKPTQKTDKSKMIKHNTENTVHKKMENKNSVNENNSNKSSVSSTKSNKKTNSKSTSPDIWDLQEEYMNKLGIPKWIQFIIVIVEFVGLCYLMWLLIGDTCIEIFEGLMNEWPFNLL